MSPDEITRLARLHLVVNDDWRIFGVEAFARAIEQAATRKVVALIADDAHAMTFQAMAQYRSALIHVLLPDSEGER